jgi:uncharacterized membrane-anchored protein YhcB (DUF1043 family)
MREEEPTNVASVFGLLTLSLIQLNAAGDACLKDVSATQPHLQESSENIIDGMFDMAIKSAGLPKEVASCVVGVTKCDEAFQFAFDDGREKLIVKNAESAELAQTFSQILASTQEQLDQDPLDLSIDQSEKPKIEVKDFILRRDKGSDAGARAIHIDQEGQVIRTSVSEEGEGLQIEKSEVQLGDSFSDNFDVDAEGQFVSRTAQSESAEQEDSARSLDDELESLADPEDQAFFRGFGGFLSDFIMDPVRRFFDADFDIEDLFEDGSSEEATPSLPSPVEPERQRQIILDSLAFETEREEDEEEEIAGQSLESLQRALAQFDARLNGLKKEFRSKFPLVQESLQKAANGFQNRAKHTPAEARALSSGSARSFERRSFSTRSAQQGLKIFGSNQSRNSPRGFASRSNLSLPASQTGPRRESQTNSIGQSSSSYVAAQADQQGADGSSESFADIPSAQPAYSLPMLASSIDQLPNAGAFDDESDPFKETKVFEKENTDEAFESQNPAQEASFTEATKRGVSTNSKSLQSESRLIRLAQEMKDKYRRVFKTDQAPQMIKNERAKDQGPDQNLPQETKKQVPSSKPSPFEAFWADFFKAIFQPHRPWLHMKQKF